MPKHLPVSDVRELGKKHALKQAILLAWDGERSHVVTWGITQEDCAQAAEGGNKLKAALGWPDDMCRDEPSALKKVRARNKELEGQVKTLSETLKLMQKSLACDVPEPRSTTTKENNNE